MEEQLKKAKEILSKYKQEHLLQFYDELLEDEQRKLLNQILSIHFDEILQLYEKSKLDVLDSTEEVEPLPFVDKSKLSEKDLSFYSDIGKRSIQAGEIAVVTLAGGQGSRLGFKGPKGTFELDIVPKKSLFEILCDNLKKANAEYNVTIPWYIMTSIYNDEQSSSYNRFF